jgi:hypothetical protein
MREMDLTLERPGDSAAAIRVCRIDRSEVPVRLRSLDYDGCAFESEQPFAPGEPVSIHLFRMGWIRARITSVRGTVIEARFDQDCPV